MCNGAPAGQSGGESATRVDAPHTHPAASPGCGAVAAASPAIMARPDGYASTSVGVTPGAAR